MFDFDQINRVALSALPILLHRWMPDGRQRGREFIARNPSREDRRPGSFTINTATGRWADYTPEVQTPAQVAGVSTSGVLCGGRSELSARPACAEGQRSLPS